MCEEKNQNEENQKKDDFDLEGSGMWLDAAGNLHYDEPDEYGWDGPVVNIREAT